MNNKTESLKEKLRQALSSTARVISDDLGINTKKNIKNSEKQDLIELENLYLKKIYPLVLHVNHFTQSQKK